jgi:hypothetical protein
MTTAVQREEWARLAAYPYLDHESQMAAMAREAIPALLADLERAEARIRELELTLCAPDKKDVPR